MILIKGGCRLSWPDDWTCCHHYFRINCFNDYKESKSPCFWVARVCTTTSSQWTVLSQLSAGLIVEWMSEWVVGKSPLKLSDSRKPARPSTGSTIRNWDKLKTWLDQMFWQIYKKLILSGFLSSGNLCLIHHLKLFWPHTSSTASDRKGAKIQHKFWWFCQKIFFSKQQNKVLKLLNSRIWKPLKSSVVIFQALETSSSSWTSAAFAASAASTASKGQFSQEKVWSWLSDHHWHQNNQYWSFFVE